MSPVIKDGADGLTEEEIREACIDFVKRGAMAQQSVNELLQRCHCGHVRAQHGPTVDQANCHGCDCKQFVLQQPIADDAGHRWEFTGDGYTCSRCGGAGLLDLASSEDAPSLKSPPCNGTVDDKRRGRRGAP